MLLWLSHFRNLGEENRLSVASRMAGVACVPGGRETAPAQTIEVVLHAPKDDREGHLSQYESRSLNSVGLKGSDDVRDMV